MSRVAYTYTHNLTSLLAKEYEKSVKENVTIINAFTAILNRACICSMIFIAIINE